MSFEVSGHSLFWLPKPGPEWSRNLGEIVARDTDGRLLRGACSAELSISQLRNVKSAIAKAGTEGRLFPGLRSLRLGLIGAGTLDFLADAVPGTAPRFGMKIEVAATHFNSIATAAFGDVDFAGPVDAVVLMPAASTFRHPATLLDKAEHDRAIAEAIAQLERILDSMEASHGCPVVLATIPGEPDRAVGAADRSIYGSNVRFLADLNNAIVDLATSRMLTLWDLQSIAATAGLRLWRDPVSLNVAKSPFAINLAPLVADRLCAALAPLFGKSRRGLVLDLDNTLWGGVIGDDGLAGIAIGQGDAVGEAHLGLQRYALELRRRGVVLCICSKNEDLVARSPFREHPDMLLREEHIAIFQANWNDKATNLKLIADELSLNVDSLVFMDDNPAERARVRQLFPEVAVPELPDDPAFFTACLSSGGYFEASALNRDDLVRAEAYQANARRAEIRQTLGNYDEYLDSLGMILTVRRFDAIGRARIVQLINKSNQFNLTTRRRQNDDVEAIERSEDHIGIQFRLADVFGDNGMISVVILEKQGDDLLIDTWLMSCRVLERGVERAVLNEIIRIAKTAGLSRVVGEYIPSPRNAMVRDHYEKLRFKAVASDTSGEGHTRWELSVATFQPFELHMAIDSAE